MFESRSDRSEAQGEKSSLHARGDKNVLRRRLLFGLAAVGACALFSSAWFVLGTRDGERALPGVHVAGQDVSRLTRAEITARVEAWAATQA
jgi:hypothetical protein